VISNWKRFHTPYEPMDHFLRSEPFPTNEVKATYIDSPSGKKTPRSKKKCKPGDCHAALLGGRG
jgi:hypothetical protein